MVGTAFFAGVIHVLSWLVYSCGQPFVVAAIDSKTAATCGEFWLNRYQSLIAALIALVGAWLTIQTMMRQTEMVRADDADRRLSKHVAAVKRLINSMQDVPKPGRPNPTPDVCIAKFAEYRRITEEAVISEAMADSIIGPDVKMLALLRQKCLRRAEAAANNRDTTEEDRLIGPLGFALLESLNRRQDRLQRGAPVADLYGLALIDQKEVFTALREKRPPILE